MSLSPVTMRVVKRPEEEAGNRVKPGDDAGRETTRGGGTPSRGGGEGARRAIGVRGHSGYADVVTGPASVRVAGLIVAVQGAAGLVVAAILAMRGLAGADQHVVNGFGTAIWFLLVGGAVLAAGSALIAGKRWGRGLAVFTQLLLLPVAWYLAVGSHRPVFGIPLAVMAAGVLALLFSPAAVRWAAGQRGAASSANPGPETR